MRFENTEDACHAARKLRNALTRQHGHKVTVAQSLDLVAQMCGARSWHVLSARLQSPADYATLLQPFTPHCLVGDVGNDDEVSLVAVEFDLATARVVAEKALSCIKSRLSEVCFDIGGTCWFSGPPEAIQTEYDEWDYSDGRWLKFPLATYAEVTKDSDDCIYVLDKAHVTADSFWLSGYCKHGVSEFDTEWLDLKQLLPDLTLNQEELIATIVQNGSFKVGSVSVTPDTLGGRFVLSENGTTLTSGYIEQIHLTLRLALFVAAAKQS